MPHVTIGRIQASVMGTLALLLGGLGGQNRGCGEVAVGSCEQDAALGGPGGRQGPERGRGAPKSGISANVPNPRRGKRVNITGSKCRNAHTVITLFIFIYIYYYEGQKLKFFLR